jgi:hypothetical protein
MRVGELKELWETKYHNAEAPDLEWTGDDEIEWLRNGDHSPLSETEIMKQALQTENESLQIQLKTISNARRVAIFRGLLGDMEAKRRDKFLSQVGLQEKEQNVSVNDDEEDEESNKLQHFNENQGNGFAQLLQFYADSSEDEDGFGNNDDDDESYNPEVPPLKDDSNSNLSLEQNLSTVHESKPVKFVDQESSSSDPSSNESDEDSKLRRAEIMLRKDKRDIRGTLQGNYDEEDDLLASNAKPRPRAIRSSRCRAVAEKDSDFQYDFSALSEDSSSETNGKTMQDTSINSIQDESKMEETSGEPSPPPAVRRSARAAKRRAKK